MLHISLLTKFKVASPGIFLRLFHSPVFHSLYFYHSSNENLLQSILFPLLTHYLLHPTHRQFLHLPKNMYFMVGIPFYSWTLYSRSTVSYDLPPSYDLHKPFPARCTLHVESTCVSTSFFFQPSRNPFTVYTTYPHKGKVFSQ